MCIHTADGCCPSPQSNHLQCTSGLIGFSNCPLLIQSLCMPHNAELHPIRHKIFYKKGRSKDKLKAQQTVRWLPVPKCSASSYETLTPSEDETGYQGAARDTDNGCMDKLNSLLHIEFTLHCFPPTSTWLHFQRQQCVLLWSLSPGYEAGRSTGTRGSTGPRLRPTIPHTAHRQLPPKSPGQQANSHSSKTLLRNHLPTPQISE